MAQASIRVGETSLELVDTTHVDVLRTVAPMLRDAPYNVPVYVEIDGLVHLDRTYRFALLWPSPPGAVVGRLMDRLSKRTAARLSGQGLLQQVIDEWLSIGRMRGVVMNHERKMLNEEGTLALLRAIPEIGLNAESRAEAYKAVALVNWLGTQKTFWVDDVRAEAIDIYLTLLSELIRPVE